jgi:hypothetical protein
MSFKAIIQTEIEVTSNNICKVLGLPFDTYIELRYELAYEWLQHYKYAAETGRFYILSATFNIWWIQSVNWRERCIINTLNAIESHGSRIDYYREAIRTIPVFPPVNLMNIMCNEGVTALIRNPELKHIKIY